MERYPYGYERGRAVDPGVGEPATQIVPVEPWKQPADRFPNRRPPPSFDDELYDAIIERIKK